ncbi:glycosyltransferase [Marinifilum sp. N1E240]|uniref:glycosyltransferase n=1 Tax=Marinifilum sp. N1E240 TaxID=2608082 RepID=UPI00128C860B|nr:glycosyltransferase [Marinifilum sp. N1E240]MPQ46461.1 glycosyltransferase [Marinifilum sp. N1E240]
MKKDKSVLYVGGFNLPDKNAAAQRVINNGKLFSKLGYEIFYIDVEKTDECHNKLFKAEIFEGLEYKSKSQKYPNSKQEWFNFITSIKFIKETIRTELNNNVDIIVAYNYPAVSLWKLIKYCKYNNIKLITDVTEWYFPEGNLFFKIIKGFDSYVRMHYLHRQVDGVIAISQYLQDFYKKECVVRLPPLVDKKNKKWETVDFKPTKLCELIYVGSLSHGQKDRLDFILLALARIKNRVRDFKFTMIGLTQSEYIEYFGLDSIPENIKENIFFEGRKSHGEVISKIKKSDYTIFLRSNNLLNSAGFPTKFVESIACGTPVLTNDSSNICEYFSIGEIGYLLSICSDEKLDESLANAINQDKGKILEMKNTCSDFDKFHYEAYETEFRFFIDKLHN